jgi:hypothetical protein
MVLAQKITRNRWTKDGLYLFSYHEGHIISASSLPASAPPPNLAQSRLLSSPRCANTTMTSAESTAPCRCHIYGGSLRSRSCGAKEFRRHFCASSRSDRTSHVTGRPSGSCIWGSQSREAEETRQPRHSKVWTVCAATGASSGCEDEDGGSS